MQEPFKNITKPQSTTGLTQTFRNQSQNAFHVAVVEFWMSSKTHVFAIGVMALLGGDKAFKTWALVEGFLIMLECILEAQGMLHPPVPASWPPCVSSLFCYVFLPSCTTLYRPESNNIPQTSEIMSQNKHFFFLSWSSQIFCYIDKRLTSI